MTRALFYHQGRRWNIGVAFGAAILIHVAAIAVASNHRSAQAEPAGVLYEPEFFLDPSPPTTLPEQETPDPLPTPPQLDQDFQDEIPNPPPVRKQTRPIAPILKTRPSSVPGPVNLSAAKVFAVSTPRPEYPYEARRQKITGSGIVVMNVDPATGSVTSVSMSKSTGSAFLDNAAIAGFRRWRFKPGTVATVSCPVTFTLTGGASY